MLRWSVAPRFARGLGVLRAPAAALALNVAASQVAGAQSQPPLLEFWTGAIATEQSWTVYVGGTTAPFGNLHTDGWRIRGQAGVGTYSFRGHHKHDGENYKPLRYRDDLAFFDALAGYQAQFGPLTAKAFAGASFSEHTIDGPSDFTPEISGQNVGPKAQVKLWYDAGGAMWVSLNGSYTTILDTYSANSRVGWRVLPNLSLGVETAIQNRLADKVDLAGAYANGGAFLRYAWPTGEISLSAGLTVDLDTDDTVVIEDQTSPYAAMSWLTKF